jgi:purine-nucleoside/S-methyl-5'-thioadenosine phosphorylase / adenosine deaminase
MAETAGGNGVLAIPLGAATALFGDASSSPAGLDEGGLAAAAGDAVERRFARAVPVLYARQLHGRLSYTYSAAGPLPPGPHLVGGCDALLTAEPWTALAVRTADCLPVALAGGGVVAMVHAGWRGLAADVLGAVTGRLGAEFGTAADVLDAVVGVGVGPCHYRVGDEVGAALERLPAAGAGWRGDGVVDLARFAAGRLAALGLDPARVRVLPGCTACSPAYHSYRRDGAAAGRQWSAIVIAAG